MAALDTDATAKDKLQKELDKAQENDLLLIERALRPEVLQVIRVWEEKIAYYTRKLGVNSGKGWESFDIGRPNEDDADRLQLTEQVVRLRQQVTDAREDRKSYRAESIMIVPVRELEAGAGMSIACFYVSQYAIGSVRQPAAYIRFSETKAETPKEPASGG